MYIPVLARYHVKDSYHLRPLPPKKFWGCTLMATVEGKTYIGEAASLAPAIERLIKDMGDRGVQARMVGGFQRPCVPGYGWEVTIDDVLEVGVL